MRCTKEDDDDERKKKDGKETYFWWKSQENGVNTNLQYVTFYIRRRRKSMTAEAGVVWTYFAAFCVPKVLERFSGFGFGLKGKKTNSD